MPTINYALNEYFEALNIRYEENEIHIIFTEIACSLLKIPTYKVKEFLIENHEISELEKLQFQHYLKDLETGKPIQYVLGHSNFFGNTIWVNRDVLIPRPETEELVEWILEDAQGEKQKILDIGTGSGAIALALAWKLPHSSVSAMDISEKALALAQKNAENWGVSIVWKQQNILDENTLDWDTKFDIIVSNPPYIREKDFVEEGVYEFEPQSALYVRGKDPLLFYSHIIRFAKQYLKDYGAIYVEINQFLAEQTKELFTIHYKNTLLKKDISGNYRFIKASH